MPNFVISLNISFPECCPIIQYINNCNVCLLVGFALETLKSHKVSYVKKSPSPDETTEEYPLGKKLNPSTVTGP